MKLLICSGIFPPEVGGPATYSRVLADEFVRRGHEVTVITYKDNRDQPESYTGNREVVKAGYRVIRIPRRKNKLWHYFHYFLAVLRYGWNAEVWYAQDPVSSGLPTWIGSKILRKPFVLKITGDYSWERAVNMKVTAKLIDDFQHEPGFPEEVNTIRQTQIRVAKNAELIIVPSFYLKRLVSGWGVTRPIEMIYNAIPDIWDCDKQQARADLDIGPEEFFIFSAGRNVPWKGFQMLEEVLIDLRSIHPNIKFKILHSAPQKEVLKNIKAADIFVLNTAYEGASHIILEAMILGTVVVATKVCGNPEFVEDGVTGLLVEFNNRDQIKKAILKLYADRALGQKFSENAKHGMEKFSLEQMINQTEKVLENYARIND